MASKKITILQNVLVKPAPQSESIDDVFNYDVSRHQLLKYLLDSGVTPTQFEKDRKKTMEVPSEGDGVPGTSKKQDSISQLLQCSPQIDLESCIVDLETPSQFMKGYIQNEDEVVEIEEENVWMQTEDDEGLIAAGLLAEEMAEIGEKNELMETEDDEALITAVLEAEELTKIAEEIKLCQREIQEQQRKIHNLEKRRNNIQNRSRLNVVN